MDQAETLTERKILFMEKITMKDIADALNISRVTVSKAFNNQSGVSDSLRELIFAKAKELGYAKLPIRRWNSLRRSSAPSPWSCQGRTLHSFGPISSTAWRRSLPITM